MFGKGV